MNISLHKKARTTPEVRREIQAADPSISNNAIARRHGVSNLSARTIFSQDANYAGSHDPRQYPYLHRGSASSATAGSLGWLLVFMNLGRGGRLLALPAVRIYSAT